MEEEPKGALLADFGLPQAREAAVGGGTRVVRLSSGIAVSANCSYLGRLLLLLVDSWRVEARALVAPFNPTWPLTPSYPRVSCSHLQLSATLG